MSSWRAARGDPTRTTHRWSQSSRPLWRKKNCVNKCPSKQIACIMHYASDWICILSSSTSSWSLVSVTKRKWNVPWKLMWSNVPTQRLWKAQVFISTQRHTHIFGMSFCHLLTVVHLFISAVCQFLSASSINGNKPLLEHCWPFIVGVGIILTCH